MITKSFAEAVQPAHRPGAIEALRAPEGSLNGLRHLILPMLQRILLDHSEYRVPPCKVQIAQQVDVQLVGCEGAARFELVHDFQYGVGDQTFEAAPAVHALVSLIARARIVERKRPIR